VDRKKMKQEQKYQIWRISCLLYRPAIPCGQDVWNRWCWFDSVHILVINLSWFHTANTVNNNETSCYCCWNRKMRKLCLFLHVKWTDITQQLLFAGPHRPHNVLSSWFK